MEKSKKILLSGAGIFLLIALIVFLLAKQTTLVTLYPDKWVLIPVQFDKSEQYEWICKNEDWADIRRNDGRIISLRYERDTLWYYDENEALIYHSFMSGKDPLYAETYGKLPKAAEGTMTLKIITK